MLSSSRKKKTLEVNSQFNSFAAETFLLRKTSEATRYKLATLMMFVFGVALLTLGTWVLNDFEFLSLPV
tara:strand:- start:168 stop:374 length:207 start_codon:yes stop_codon:yes gene_type:complete